MRIGIFLGLSVLCLAARPYASADARNYCGIQFASLISGWPGLHVDYERRVFRDYGALISAAGYRWDSRRSFRSDSDSPIHGFSAKAEARRYFAGAYLAVPIAFTAFDEGLARGGYRYGSAGLGLGRKKTGKRFYLDANIQVLFADRDPVADAGREETSALEGTPSGFEIIPEKFSWILDSAYPNMNLDLNLIFGYAW